MTSDTKRKTTSNQLTAGEIRSYLERNRNFFVSEENQELLEHLTIPHNSGRSISLLEYQVQLFRQQRDNAFSQLDQLIEIHRFNQNVAAIFHTLVQEMILAPTPSALIAVFARCWKGVLAVDLVGLHINNEDLQNRLNYKGNRIHLLYDDVSDLPEEMQQAARENKVLCGTIGTQMKKLLRKKINTGSFVVLPLGKTGDIPTSASLLLVSKDKSRFLPDMQTDMIRFVCDVFFISLLSRLTAKGKPTKRKQQ